MARKKRISKEDEEIEEELRNYKPRIERQAFYFSLFIGVVILIAGVILTMSDSFLPGITSAGRSGIGGGQEMIINGPGLIILGALVLLICFSMKLMRK